MKILSNALKALASVFSWLKQKQDPENIRLRTMTDIDEELDKLRKERDEILARGLLLEQEEADAIELGAIVERIVFLRQKREALER